MKSIEYCALICLLSIQFLFNNQASAQLPEGFEYTLLSDQIPGAVTIDFAENGLMYVCDLSGKVWLIEDDEIQPEPVLDISDEVANYGELGCLGFALHPDFELNGYLYLLYAVDRHHLFNFGTPDYDPEANEYDQASIGRLTRYQVQLSDYRTLVPDSRTVLYGESIGEGNPCVAPSHGTGDMVFGSDGSLFFSTGDGNTWANFFAGGNQAFPAYSYDEQALQDGILAAEEHVGSFRAQQIQSYSGKVLRIDAETGEGLPGNPFYDSDNPNAASSKVWALGLRNPYRMTLKPGTGSENIEDAVPGTLYITDVGYNEWEEINVCDGPGYNFGWPLYEGLNKQEGFYNKVRKNFFQPNPIQSSTCSSDYFTFQQLFVQENGQHEYFFPNPCNAASNMAEYATVFHHTRPVLCYRNTAQEGEPPMLPGFDEDGEAIGIPITTSEAGVEQAANFTGIAAMTGDFYNGESYPEEYHNIIPVLDYQGWLKVFWFDGNHNLTKMEHWMSGLQNVVDMRFNPNDECYYTIGMFPSQIHRLCFVGNLSPVINATATPQFGTSPLEVTFDASETYDPDGDPLTFQWDFGDGETSNEVVVAQTYTAPTSDPHSFNAVLTVSDTAGNTVDENFLISLNNTPPQVEITSITDSTIYAMASPTSYPLAAEVSDEEHSNSELTYSWNTFLHHNTHFHALTSSSQNTDNFVLYPVGCGLVDSYYFRVSLLVTDSEGLTGYDEVFLFPDCDGDTNNTPPGVSEDAVFYPNPSYGVAELFFSQIDAQTEVTVAIYSINGKLLQEYAYVVTESNKRIGLNLENLSSGQYILKAFNEQFHHTIRFSKVTP